MNQSTKAMWEWYPDNIADIAKQEAIYHDVMPAALMSAGMRKDFYQEYLKLVKNPDASTSVTDRELEIAESFVRTAAMRQADSPEKAEKALRYVELTWPAYRKKMQQSPAFAKWVFEAGVLFSAYLYRFYIEVDGFLDFDPQLREEISPVTSYQMETAFGRYCDLSGELKTIPSTDPATWHCLNSELWDTVRFRSPYFMHYMIQAGHGATVVDLCSGALNLERRFGYCDRGLQQKVVAYDIDQKLPEVLSKLFVEPLENYGYEFHNEPIAAAFKNPDLINQADLAMMAGGMSYNYDDTKEILLGMRRLLKDPNSSGTPVRCVFDVQTLTPGMGHAKYVLGLGDQHASLHPDMTVAEATDRVKGILNEIGCFEVESIITDEGFFGSELEYTPTTVLFVLKAK